MSSCSHERRERKAISTAIQRGAHAQAGRRCPARASDHDPNRHGGVAGSSRRGFRGKAGGPTPREVLSSVTGTEECLNAGEFSAFCYVAHLGIFQ